MLGKIMKKCVNNNRGMHKLLSCKHFTCIFISLEQVGQIRSGRVSKLCYFLHCEKIEQNW